MLPKRREARLSAELDFRLLGIDANGKAFHQAVETVNIGLSGARVTGLTAPLKPGDIVGLKSQGDKCSVKVSWISDNMDGTYQLGLQCVNKATTPWRDNLQQITCGYRRIHERYPCNGSVSFLSEEFPAPIWGTLRDIGAGGCYVQSVGVAPMGEIVSAHFIVNLVQIDCMAEVRTSRATLGMGLSWCDLGCDGQEKLDNVLRRLSLKYNEVKSKNATAQMQLEKLDQLVATLRERLGSRQNFVDIHLIGQLSAAQEKLTAALKNAHQLRAGTRSVR